MRVVLAALLGGWLASISSVVAAQCADEACVKTSAALANVNTQQSALLDTTITSTLGLPGGTAVDLTVADHNALASTDISLSGLLDLLNNEGVGVDANGALQTPATLDQILAAAQLQAGSQNNAAAAAAISKLRSQTVSVSNQQIKLGDLITVDTRSGPLANNQINLLDLVTGTASTFNETNVVAARNVSVNGSDVGIGNASTIDIAMVVIDSAKIVCGPVGSQFYSAGVRIRVHLNLNALGVNLSVPPLTSLRLNLTQLDLVAAVSRASGTITAINAVAGTLTVQATPGIAELYLGTISNENFVDRNTPIDPASELTPAVVGGLDLNLLGITATATVSAKGYALGTTPTAKTLNFTAPYPKTLTATTQADFASNLINTLLGNLQVTVSTYSNSLGLITSLLNTLVGNVTTAVTGALKSTADTGLLKSVLSPLATNVLDPLLAELGIKLGEVSVTASAPYKVTTGSTCNDNQFCTENDTCSASGVCTGSAKTCADTLGCTTDACDEVNDRCTNTLSSTSCLINGTCVASGVADPTNQCSECNPQASSSAYTLKAIGAACSDGLFCTRNDTCGLLGVCAGLSLDCTDSLSCTLDACDELNDRCTNLVSLGCVINGQCVAAGTDDPTSACRSCNPLLSTTTFSNKVSGTPCADGLFCTVGDACNGMGVCAATARDCSDGLGCTNDACDEMADACTSAVSGGCLIGGLCYGANAPNPSNACLACNPGISTTAWSARAMGTSCDDGLFCTDNDSCNGSGSCVGTTKVCSPGGSGCSSVCDETLDQCRSNIQGCLVGNACVAQGTVNPLNGCQICNTLATLTGYSNATAGVACDDGLFCTTGDSCNGLGLCTGSARDCADNSTCTVDSCDEANDRCGSEVAAGGCLIGGQCVTAGVSDPSNPCRACNPLMSTTSWTNRLAGSACSDGLFCTTGDICNGEGACSGTMRDCDSGDACDTVCDETQDRCRDDLDGCTINGACVAIGGSDPGNPCHTCNPSANRFGWSNKSAGSSCDDGLYCTTSDSCSALGLCLGTPRGCGGSGACTAVCNEQQDSCVGALTGCNIDGVCRAAGSINPANPCQLCNPAASTSAWSLSPVGTLCSDGLFCTTGDTCNASGLCSGGVKDCSDNKTCTADICDEVGDRCVSTVNTGCLVDGECFPSGVTDPNNSCRTCNPLVSSSGWTNKAIAVACSDGLYCTENDGCDGQGLCVGTLRSCGSGGTCDSFCDETTASCRTGITGCNVSGTCVAAGTLDPSNPCRGCDPTLSTVAWTLRPAGTLCSDGQFCTSGDVCTGGGVCAGMAVSCNDNLSCSTDSCNEVSDACVNAITGGCTIDGSCVPAGVAAPEGPCRICDPTRSTTSYSSAVLGTVCDDTQFCTTLDRCDGSGVCVGTGVRCPSDGLGCTSETCDESSDSCSVTVTTGCAIGNQCFADGASAPNDKCRVCRPGLSTGAFTYEACGAQCDSDGDGLLDCYEQNPDGSPIDHDQDGIPDFLDPDDDNDGIPTREELSDPNGDGNPLDSRDLDEDGVPDYLDGDDDGDDRSTRKEREDAIEYGDDVDGDGIDNWYDFDSDDDGASDAAENYVDGDSNDDGIPDYVQPDVQPADDDRDGIPTAVECPNGKDACADSDGDGLPNWNDPDDDGDSVLTKYELRHGARKDTDRDAIYDHLDTDDDGDTLPTKTEEPDPNGDGNPNDARDTDGDGSPDYLDDDDDGDGIPTKKEVEDSKLPDGGVPDPDNDGIPPWLDPDSDDDGLPDAQENNGPNSGDGNNNGIPDYLEGGNSVPDSGVSSDGGLSPIDASRPVTDSRVPAVDSAASDGGDAGLRRRGGLAGGSLCTLSAHANGAGYGALWVLAALGGMAWRRRKQR